MDIAKLKEAFNNAEQKNKNPQLSRITNLENSIANYGKTWQNEQSANALKKTINFEKMRAAFDSNDDLLQKLNEVEKSVIERSNFYSQFKTAEDYDKAKREYGYSTKYQGKTYDDISKHLASDDYKTMRKDGRISDEEDTWLRNNKYQLASSKEIQVEIDDLQKFLNDYDAVKLKKDSASISNMHNEFNPQSSIMPDKSKVNAANKEFQQHYKSLGYRSETEYHKDAESKRALLEILETTKAKKKQVEDFNKKWANETEGFDKSIAVPTNDQLESALVTDDEVGFLAKAAAYSMDGSLIGGFISDKILRDEKNFDDYAALLNESEKKNIINLAKTNRVKATEYFNDLITIRLDEEYNEQIKANAAGFTSENQLFAKLGSIGSVATSLGSGIETIGNWLTGDTDRRSRLSSVTTGLREGTKTHWDGTWGEEAWDFLYDTGMSAADSAAAAGLSAVVPFSGEFLLGASAAANTYNDMLDRGVTGGDAVLGSVAVGAAEGLFEHISIGQLPSLKAGSLTGGFTKAGFKQFLKESGKQILVNATEEELTQISNIITDNLISGDLSSYAIAAEQYYMQGYSAEEAKKKAAQDLGEQVAMAGLSGALMGFGFGAGGSVVGLSNSNIKNSKAGNAVLNTENGLDTLKSIANKSGFKDIANEAEKLTEKSKPSEVGYVFNRLYEKSVEKSIDAMLPELTENGATKGGSNSAKGWASQIIKTAIAPESDDKRSKANTLRANKVTSNVYAAFADEGKYGAATLFELNDLVAFKPATKEQIAENMNKRIAIDRAIKKYSKSDFAEEYEANRPTFGTNELPTEIRDNLNKISANGTSGPVSQIFGKNVAANLEKQSPAPKKSDKIKITPKGEKIVKQRGKAMGVKVIFTDDLVDGIGDGKTVDHKTVYISRYSVNPMKELIKHEFTHTTEISKLYSKFSKHIFNDSKAFDNWIKRKGYTSWSQLADEIIESFHENDVTYKDEYDAAKREIVAMFVSENLFNEKTANEEITSDFLSELRQIDRAWYERFIDWVKSIFARLKTVDGIQRDIIKLEQQFLRLVETADRENAPKGTVYSESKNSNSQYMFAGPNAKTANKLTLATAKQWLKDGKDSEFIRQETGWFKGYDGKWRFEISDEAADVDWKQAANDMLKILDLEYARSQLFEKNITSKEFAKVAKKYFEQKVNNKLLTDYMEHKELFEAYPELLETRVYFVSMNYGNAASYDPFTNVISINYNHVLEFSGDDYTLKQTLLHELQHAVQSIEGFSRGASNVVWQERKKNGEQFLDSNGNEISDIDLYKMTAGEIEARDTEERYKLTEAERKENRPNIDRDDVIFVEKDYSKTADGVQYSIPSDHVYSYNNGKASFTEDRLTALLDEHSLGDGKRADYSNAFVAYISPNDFVNLTSNDRIRGRVEDEAYILDKDELRNETETPFIEYNPETGEVVNHEGRHRMVALQAEGISNVAVVLKPSTDSFARLQPQDINLTGQDFAGGKAQGNVTVKNAIPLSEKYRDETTAQFAQNPDADVRYSLPNIETKQQFDELLEEKYEVFSTKKPIKVTTAEWSSVNSLRTQRYGNIPEEDIPTIDYFEIGTYNKVNQGYVYFVRNSDKWNFSIVSKRKLRKAERSVDDGESSGSKINGTRTSKGFDKSSNTRSVGNGGAVQPNAFVFENETGSNERGNFDNWNDTSRGTVRSNRNEADPIDGSVYSLPDIDALLMEILSAPASSRRAASSIVEIPPPTVKGMLMF